MIASPRNGLPGAPCVAAVLAMPFPAFFGAVPLGRQRSYSVQVRLLCRSSNASVMTGTVSAGGNQFEVLNLVAIHIAIDVMHVITVRNVPRSAFHISLWSKSPCRLK